MTDQLDTVREALPGCSVVAFADLSAGLVLCVSATRRPAQEVLDRLCDMANDLLNGAAAQSAVRVLHPGPDDPAVAPVDRAIAMPAGQSYLFLRSASDPVEALCCIGSTAMDLGAAETALRQTLAGIEAQT
ncbi:hypothetical protein [Frigidibacter sp. ROC022]|uniref:hypothetical protein n=1 Tax=Frigidibacter sp. ROC022 TaxID=2971796 RepID=UPI00215A9C73|nr:hypothetical protein [Frigidibacter sp. ROC022]MCR8725021.1 hypothetical protein [Frigidibacter sp. ROC022]